MVKQVEAVVFDSPRCCSIAPTQKVWASVIGAVFRKEDDGIVFPRNSEYRQKGEQVMPNLSTIEVKAFVPAKDFELSKRFYSDLGFDLAWADEHLAEFQHGDARFLLQNFYHEGHAANFMMHLLVEDVDAWWDKVSGDGIPATYGVTAQPPKDHPGHMRDFTLVDPTGVLWRIGQVTKI